MKTRFLSTILFCFLGIITSQSLQAQGIFDRISDSIDKGISSASDKAIEKVVERMIEKLFSGESVENDTLSNYGGTPDSSQTKSNSTVDLSNIFGSSAPVDKVYTFDYKLDYKITSGDNESNTYLQRVPQEGSYMAMEISSLVSIMDFETMKNYAIINGKLTSINVAKMLEKHSFPDPEDAEESDMEYELTDQYETIAGYRCRLAKCYNDKETYEIWYTEDFVTLNVSGNNLVRAMDPNAIAAYPMRMTQLKKGKVEFIQEVTKVESEVYSIDLSQY